MPKCLITGVAGFVGSRLAQWLLANVADVEVHGWDDLSGGYKENIPQGVRFQRLDLAEPTACADPLQKDKPFDYVFHFCAYAAEVLSPFIRRYNYVNNVIATANLVTASLNGLLREDGRFVYASSAAVYSAGRHGILFPPFNECDPIWPNDPYAVAKMACEHDIRLAGEQHALDYCILRLHNIYGRNQDLWDRHRNVFGLWMRAALANQEAVIYGDGQQQRAFTYIDDILPCLWKAATEPRAGRETINLGGSKPIAIGAASQIFTEVLEGANSVPPRFRFEPARHEIKDNWCSVAKSKSLLDYEDKTGLYQGLTEMWLRAQEAWERFPERRNSRQMPLELTKGLPETWAKP